MNAPRTLDSLPRMTVEEYLVWSEAQLSGRYELVDGRVIQMAAERAAHVRVKMEAAFALRRAIRAGRFDCEVFGDGIAIRVGKGSVYEPDASVQCGPPLPGDAMLLPDPVIVVEVVSPSTERVDLVRKLRGYFTVPSVQHYLVLDPEDLLLIHHRRADGDQIETGILHARPEGDEASPELILDPPGLTLAVADLFEAP